MLIQNKHCTDDVAIAVSMMAIKACDLTQLLLSNFKLVTFTVQILSEFRLIRLKSFV